MKEDSSGKSLPGKVSVSSRLAGGLSLLILILFVISGLLIMNLSHLSQALVNLSQIALPRVSLQTQVTGNLEQLLYLSNRLSQSQGQTERRISSQELENKLVQVDKLVTSLPNNEEKEKIVRILDGLKEGLLELIHISEEKQLLNDRIQWLQPQLLELSERVGETLSETVNPALSRGLAEMTSIIYSTLLIPQSPYLSNLRNIERHSQLEIEQLKEEFPENPHLDSLQLLLFDSEGFFRTSEQRLRVVNRISGIDNFTRSLIEDLVRMSSQTYNLVNQEAWDTAQNLNKSVELQIFNTVWLGILALVLVLGIYLYFRRFLTKRLLNLGAAVLDRLAGKKTPIDDKGNDEIGEIARATAYFAQELENREQRLRIMLEASPIGVGIAQVNPDVILYANRGCAQLFGYTIEAQNFMSLRSFFVNDNEHKTVMDQIQKEGRLRNFELELLRKDGSTFWTLLSVEPLEKEDNPSYLFWILDVNDLKKVQAQLSLAKEEAEGANLSKSAFLANMSHEIRTPMNAIIGMSHLALGTKLTQSQRVYLDRIQSSAQNLLGILNDILDFSKIEAGKLELEVTPFVFGEVLESLTDVLILADQKTEIDMIVEVDSSVPDHLLGDPLRLRQILINVLGNAQKFTSKGEIHLKIQRSPKRGKTGQVYLEFSLRDTGVGMSTAQMSKLFGSFSQADSSITRKYGGTGLGLAICKQLVELMGGTIRVESQEGLGTSFFITLPFELETNAIPTLSSKKQKLKILKGKRVLVIDSPCTSRRILIRALEENGIAGETADSTLNAEGLILQAIQNMRPYDLVIVEQNCAPMYPSFLDGIPFVKMGNLTGQGVQSVGWNDQKIIGFLSKPVLTHQLNTVLLQAFDPNFELYSAEKVPHLENITFPGAKILLVEDHPINRELALALLAPMGVEVVEAENGQQAVELCQQDSFDLVLMDIQMPVMDGFSATRILREGPRYRKTPIVAMTAHALSGDRQKSLDAGMNDHITKPISPRKLRELLSQWLPTKSKDVARSTKESKSLSQPQSSFNFEYSLDLWGGDVNLLKKVLGSFLSQFGETPQVLQTEWENLQNKAFEPTTGTLLHSLKGVSASLALLQLQHLCGEAEQALYDHERNDYTQILPKLKEELEKVLQLLSPYSELT